MKTGPKTKYTEDIPDKLIDYFSSIKTVTIMEKEFPRFNSVEGFCATLPIAKSTFYAWVAKYDEMSNALGIAKSFQADQIFQLGANKIFSESYSKLLTINCTDMKEKVEHAIDKDSEIALLGYQLKPKVDSGE